MQARAIGQPACNIAGRYCTDDICSDHRSINRVLDTVCALTLTTFYGLVDGLRCTLWRKVTDFFPDVCGKGPLLADELDRYHSIYIAPRASIDLAMHADSSATSGGCMACLCCHSHTRRPACRQDPGRIWAAHKCIRLIMHAGISGVYHSCERLLSSLLGLYSVCSQMCLPVAIFDLCRCSTTVLPQFYHDSTPIFCRFLPRFCHVSDEILPCLPSATVLPLFRRCSAMLCPCLPLASLFCLRRC